MPLDNDKTLSGVICYYSGSGNTRLACQYIQNNIKNVKFDLFNITKGSLPDLSAYDVAGFATFTDFLDPPRLFLDFIGRLPAQANKPAFVFNTYGFINGKTCFTLGKRTGARGFKVVAGHSLHMPESFPPMIAGGNGNERAPNERELTAFKKFVSQMEDDFAIIRAGRGAELKGARFSFISRILPPLSRKRSRNDMGLKYVDTDLCDGCGICAKICPYAAIKMDPKPVFDMDKCYGCWSCYNHCPKKAIYTRKYRGRGHYPKPFDRLKEKFKA
jgi:ferredoxin/flavodoxin